MLKLQLTQKNLKNIIDTIPIGILVVDLAGNIGFSNNKVEELLGFTGDELLGVSVNDFVPVNLKKSHKEMIKHFASAVSDRPMASGRLLVAVNKEGVEVPCQIGLKSLTIGEESYVLVSMIETTNAILKVSSSSDPLTGLANRILFDQLSENLRNLGMRNHIPLALMFIDLDNFKNINDQFGHDVGDLVLIQVANVFTENIRKNDVVARVGGDEFVIFLYGIENKIELEHLSKKLIMEVSLIKEANAHTINIGASIGAVFAPPATDLSIATMVNMADKLMYQAKRGRKGTSLVLDVSEVLK